jgi:hypothetical protein
MEVAPFSTPFLGKSACSPHLLSLPLYWFKLCEDLLCIPWGAWVTSKVSVQSLLIPLLRSFPSQRLRPESLNHRLDPTCWPTQTQSCQRQSPSNVSQHLYLSQLWFSSEDLLLTVS